MPLIVVHGRLFEADVLSVVGDLDIASGPRLVTHASEALRGGARQLVLDLQAVGFVDSAGLASLLNVLRRATGAGGSLVLAGIRPQLARLLLDTRLDRQFAVAGTVEEAERTLSATAA